MQGFSDFLRSIQFVTGPLTALAFISVILLAVYARSVSDKNGLKYIFNIVASQEGHQKQDIVLQAMKYVFWFLVIIVVLSFAAWILGLILHRTATGNEQSPTSNATLLSPKPEERSDSIIPKASVRLVRFPPPYGGTDYRSHEGRKLWDPVIIGTSPFVSIDGEKIPVFFDSDCTRPSGGDANDLIDIYKKRNATAVHASDSSQDVGWGETVEPWIYRSPIGECVSFVIYNLSDTDDITIDEVIVVVDRYLATLPLERGPVAVAFAYSASTEFVPIIVVKMSERECSALPWTFGATHVLDDPHQEYVMEWGEKPFKLFAGQNQPVLIKLAVDSPGIYSYSVRLRVRNAGGGERELNVFSGKRVCQFFRFGDLPAGITSELAAKASEGSFLSRFYKSRSDRLRDSAIYDALAPAPPPAPPPE